MKPKKKYLNDEVDLLDMLIIVLNNKSKILVVIFLSVISMIGYLAVQEPLKLKYEARTEIRPITTFDEFGYAVYNNYLKNTGSVILQYPIKMKNDTFILNEVSMDIDNASFKIIDRKYLIDLFIQKIKEKGFLAKQIDNFGLVSKKNYKNNKEYNYAVKRLAETFTLLPNDIKGMKREKQYLLKDGWTFNFITDDTGNMKDFFAYLETNTNMEIRNYLTEYFKTIILSQQKIKKDMIEDLEYEIVNSKEESYIRRLKIEKQKLTQQRDIKRLKDSFSTTPIIKNDKFAAAYILNDTTNYKKITNSRSSDTTMIILSVIFGGLIGALYALISNSLQRRKN